MKNGVDANGRTVFGPVTASLQTLLNPIGDYLSLVLGPELESFYLTDALVLSMPVLVEDLGQLWGWGANALAHSGLSPADEKRYLVWSVGVENCLKQTRTYLQRSVLANPALKAQLSMAAFDEVRAFLCHGKRQRCAHQRQRPQRRPVLPKGRRRGGEPDGFLRQGAARSGPLACCKDRSHGAAFGLD
jgi:hypothetical protein